MIHPRLCATRSRVSAPELQATRNWRSTVLAEFTCSFPFWWTWDQQKINYGVMAGRGAERRMSDRPGAEWPLYFWGPIVIKWSLSHLQESTAGFLNEGQKWLFGNGLLVWNVHFPLSTNAKCWTWTKVSKIKKMHTLCCSSHIRDPLSKSCRREAWFTATVAR